MWNYTKSFFINSNSTSKSNSDKDMKRTIKIWKFEDVPEIYKKEILKDQDQNQNQNQEEKNIKEFDWIAFIPNEINEKYNPNWSYCEHFGKENIFTIYLPNGILRISYH